MFFSTNMRTTKTKFCNIESGGASAVTGLQRLGLHENQMYRDL